MKRYNKNLGDYGEDTAAEYFESLGYIIRKRNYRCVFGEIELIAETDGILIFAEVKTRSNNIFGTPAAAVDQKKQTHLWRAAEAFLLDHPWEDEVRFDVVEIYAKLISTGSFQLEKIHHIKNIVLEV